MPPAISTARISRPLPRMWRKRPAASLRSIRIPTRRCFRYPRSRAQCESGRRKWATAANAFQLRAAVRFHPCPCRKGPARRTETSRSCGLPPARHLAAEAHGRAALWAAITSQGAKPPGNALHGKARGSHRSCGNAGISRRATHRQGRWAILTDQDIPRNHRAKMRRKP